MHLRYFPAVAVPPAIERPQIDCPCSWHNRRFVHIRHGPQNEFDVDRLFLGYTRRRNDDIDSNWATVRLVIPVDGAVIDAYRSWTPQVRNSVDYRAQIRGRAEPLPCLNWRGWPAAPPDTLIWTLPSGDLLVVWGQAWWYDPKYEPLDAVQGAA